MNEPILLLDMGGVLVDLGTPAADMGLPMTEDEFWATWLNSPTVTRYETGGMSTRDFCARMAQEFALESDGFTDARLARWRLPLYPRVATALPALAQRATLALLSNTSAVHWNTVSRQSDAFNAFTHVFLSFEVGLHKPQPAIFEHVLRELDVAPDEIVFVDDSAQNVAAARALGIEAHLVGGFDEAERVLIAQLDRVD